MTMNAPNDQAVPRQPTAILAIILISYFMILLDNSIIFTALPTIRTAMHYSTTSLAWVQDAYTLVFGGLLLLGAAVVAPSSLSLLTASFPPGPRRVKAVALYGATAGIGASLGLVIGGALADWVSCRAAPVGA